MDLQLNNGLPATQDWGALLPLIREWRIDTERVHAGEYPIGSIVHESKPMLTIKLRVPRNLKLDRKIIDALFFSTGVVTHELGFTEFEGTLRDRALTDYILDYLYNPR